jgi:hypothetical protein
LPSTKYKFLRVIDTNRAILSVVDELLFREKALAEVTGSIANVYTVFFHDLVIHFSGILIQRESFERTSSSVLFPYVDKGYAVSPVQLDLLSRNYKREDNSLKIKVRGARILPFAIGNSIPYGYKQDYWLSKLINVLGEYQKFTKVYLQRLEHQLADLSDCITKICLLHSIENQDTVRENWLRYISFHATENWEPTTSKLLLLGNRQDLQNRKLATNFLQDRKEVIAFTHGEIASTIFDEPMYRYAERGLCSVLVEYGERGEKEAKEDKGAVMIPPQTTIYRSSRVALSRYRRCGNIHSIPLSSAKILYIPTTYVGNSIYGPYHAYPDSVYSEWHLALRKVLPNVVMKAHPKSAGNYFLPGHVETRWLDDCIEDYDVLVLDYVATSTAVAMLTNKPVIFFDIGLRRVAEHFLIALKKRCHYVSVDINGNLEEQIEDAIISFSIGDVIWTNMHIGKFCLSSGKSRDWRHILVKTLATKDVIQ